MRYLAGQPQALLVLDNVEDPNLIRPFRGIPWTVRAPLIDPGSAATAAFGGGSAGTGWLAGL